MNRMKRVVYGLLPYCVIEKHLRKVEGTADYLVWTGLNRVKTTPWYWMPHSLVSRWLIAKKERRQARQTKTICSGGMPQSGFDYGAGDVMRKVASCRDDALAVKGAPRILVCLHLYYADLWPVVRTYLDNLTPYDWTLLVTYSPNLIPESTLAEIRDYRTSVRFVPCRNAGYDIGPFVEAIRQVNLAEFGIVFKLQTKGCRRPWIFVYDQVFKRADWFVNLYDGVLGGRAVHEAVAALTSGEALLAAAENLIVRDPWHKRQFVRQICEKLGIAYDDNYRFVAGTCFAISAEALRPIQALGLTIDDFPDTVRGDFSLAHALERIFCFAARGKMKGIPVSHNEYTEETAWRVAKSGLRLLLDDRFELDPEYVYRSLEFCQIDSYEVVEVRLGDIRRVWTDCRSYRLADCAPFRYLQGDSESYDRYCEVNSKRSVFNMSRERFETLRQSMKSYDGRRMPVVFGKANIILDGQHRCCILLKEHGSDYRIPVVRIYGSEFK